MVREAARAAGATSEIVDDLVQAVDEAATNTIVHGYRESTGWVEVRLEQAGHDIVVTLEDGAVTFDPTSLPDPDMDVPAHVRGPGGMGIRLMRLATDSMRHAPRPGGGNILTMTRSLEPRPKEDG